MENGKWDKPSAGGIETKQHPSSYKYQETSIK